MTAVPIAGTCDPRFDAVRDAFVENMQTRGEIGAAVCVVDGRGRSVVDLWGGWRDVDGTAPWEPDTLVNVFSIGKGLTAACAAYLAGIGALDVDAAVESSWPEFAAAGKASITVRQLLSHQAGLPALREPLADDAMLRWDVMTTALAAERPWWEPGTAHGYHVNTFGFLVGEVLRRASGGRTVGRLLRERFGEPLGADVFIGLPPGEHGRVAEFRFPAEAVGRWDPSTLTDAQLMEYHAYANPHGLSGAGVVNTTAWRVAEIPSTNGHASARGVARVYAALAAGGAGLVDAGALRDASVEQSVGDDLVLHRPSRFGLGFQLPQPERPFGSGPGAFGHFGAGGSLGFADPDSGLGFGYVMNDMGARWQNPRNRALLDALAQSLA